MRYNVFLTFLLLILSLKYTVAQNQYSFEDIKELEKKAEFIEFFAHAKDIRPTLRDKKWQDLVKRAFKKLTLLYESSRPNSKAFSQYLNLSSWKTIKDTEELRERSLKIILNYFQSKKYTPEISAQVIEFFNANSKNPYVLYEIYKDIEKKEKLPKLKEKIVLNAAKSSLASYFCSRKEALGIFSEPIAEIIGAKPQEFDLKLSTIMNRKCWEEVKKLSLSSSSVNQIYLQSILKDPGSEQKEKKLAVILLLINHKISLKEKNILWEQFSKISENADQRQEILKTMNSYEAIPDTNILNKGQKSYYLTKFFFRKFPEFKTYYLKQCLNLFEDLQSKKPSKCKELVSLLKSEQSLENKNMLKMIPESFRL
jgi:hypothetical protein